VGGGGRGGQTGRLGGGRWPRDLNCVSGACPARLASAEIDPVRQPRPTELRHTIPVNAPAPPPPPPKPPIDALPPPSAARNLSKHPDAYTQPAEHLRKTHTLKADIAPTRGISRGEARCHSFEGLPRQVIVITHPSRSSRISHPGCGLPSPNCCVTCVKPPTSSFCRCQSASTKRMRDKIRSRQCKQPSSKRGHCCTDNALPCLAESWPIRADNIPPFHS
jgi:hypothetical protein